MRLLICGVRGSTPSPGTDFIRYGGNTSCVALAHDGQAPSLVLDGGTGLRTLSRLLDGEPFRGTILLGHLHWDHTHGLPFFAAGNHSDSSVQVLMPEQGDPSEVMARAVAPPHFPIRLEELRGRWTVGAIEPGEHRIEGFEVLALDIPHKLSRTFGFRVSNGVRSVAYLSDHWPTDMGDGPDGLGEYHESALRLCEGVDVLLHDAQYTAEELPGRLDFGHAAIEYAIGLAEQAAARKLLLFHHDPDRTDDQLDALVEKHATAAVPVGAAAEGTVIELS